MQRSIARKGTVASKALGILLGFVMAVSLTPSLAWATEGDVASGGHYPPDSPESAAQPSDGLQASSDHIAAGTYTVSANIWVDETTSGLPMQPHFTSAAFPPMDPVADNATLQVDGNGHAYLNVPIVIQSGVMSVTSISGLPIVDYASSDGGLTSITLDMGVLGSSDDDITMPCTASVYLGDLASTIIGGERNRTWAATLQMSFSGLPSSSEGEAPAAVQQMTDSADSGGHATDAAEAAEADALAALDGNADSLAGGSRTATAEGVPSGGGITGMLPLFAGALALLLAGGLFGFLVGKRRKKDNEEAA